MSRHAVDLHQIPCLSIRLGNKSGPHELNCPAAFSVQRFGDLPRIADALSTELRGVLEPLLKEIESMNEGIKEYDERMEKIAKEVYPQVSLLKQVQGVGTQIALTYVLTIEDPYRFLKSREVGCFLGLRPGRRNSGESEPQKRISKEGDRY